MLNQRISNQEFRILSEKFGIHFMGQPSVGFQTPRLAMDAAQSPLVTQSNSGILAFMSTYIDPIIIDVLVAPMKATKIVGSERKIGDWTTQTAAFPLIESTGQVKAYGDWETGGQADVNINWPQRQSFLVQVITRWGEYELERAALGKVDLANRLNLASVLTLEKFINASYFYGVQNLINYGLLNDPSLYAPIQPLIGISGSPLWMNKTAQEVIDDIIQMYYQLQVQSNGTVQLGPDTPMTLAVSPSIESFLLKITNFNVNVMAFIKTNFPNLKLETAPEYSTPSGELVQLIVNEIQAQPTAETAFNEKLRAHPIVIYNSGFSQKKTSGTYGTVIFRPFLISQMLGV